MRSMYFTHYQKVESSKVQVAIQDREALIVETIRTSLKPFASKQSHEVVIGSELREIGELLKDFLDRADSVGFAADATLEALGANGSDETVAKVKIILHQKLVCQNLENTMYLLMV